MTKFALMCFMITMTALAGCGGDDDGGGGGSIQSRCEDWCARRNADADCGAQVNCGSCAAIAANAMSCPAEADDLYDCFEASDDVCPGPGQLDCGDENTVLILCENGTFADGGT
jgi:hypothetical protein